MAQGSYYMVYIERHSGVSLKELEETMNLATDWYRLRKYLWILYTTRDEEVWSERLAPLVKEDGSLFICRLDEYKRQGWMTKEFWSWMRREREQ